MKKITTSNYYILKTLTVFENKYLLKNKLK